MTICVNACNYRYGECCLQWVKNSFKALFVADCLMENLPYVLAEGFDVATIARLTKLSIQEIESFK